MIKKKSQSIEKQADQLAKQTEARLVEVLSMRVELDQEIVRLRQLLKVLKPVRSNYKAESESNELPGLRQSCLEILQAAYEPLTATEILNKLKDRKFPVDKYKKPLAVISTTLKRLITEGKAEVLGKEGKAAYRCNQDSGFLFDQS